MPIDHIPYDFQHVDIKLVIDRFFYSKRLWFYHSSNGSYLLDSSTFS